MNKTIAAFARQQIKANLALCSEGERDIFLRMYSHKDLARPIGDAVDAMPDDKLDWALSQTENTLRKSAAKAALTTALAATSIKGIGDE